VALYDVDLALLGIRRLAVAELAGQATAAEQALAVAGQVARLAGGDPRRGGRGRLADDLAALLRVLLEPLAELVVDHLLDERLGFGVAELGLGLALELRLGELDGDDRGQGLPAGVAGGPGVPL